MKRWIVLMTACVSALTADGVPPTEPAAPETETTPTPPPATPPEESSVVEEPAAATAPPEEERKSVGTAAQDGSQTASSNAGKYLLAAGAIAVGITALILVSQNSGHHKH
jgi:hypothetical protein